MLISATHILATEKKIVQQYIANNSKESYIVRQFKINNNNKELDIID